MPLRTERDVFFDLVYSLLVEYYYKNKNDLKT